MTRDELLKRLDDSRAELNAVVAQVPSGRMLEPALANGWSVKDMLAHLGAWETRAESLYRSLSSGKDPEDTITDFNVFNAKTYDANREKPLAEIQQTEQAAFIKLRAVAQTAPEADLFDPARFPWTGGGEFAGIIAANTFDHYAEHLPDLRSWLGTK
jgi:uncharacterized protein (TIGR03083 family)